MYIIQNNATRKSIKHINEKYNKFMSLFPKKKYNFALVRRRLNRLEIETAIFMDPAIRATKIKSSGSSALKILKDIIKNTDRNVLQSIPEIRAIVQCSLILVQAYVAHLKVTRNIWDYCLPQSFASAEKCFNKLIYKLIPEYLHLVIDTVLNFFEEEHLWKVEFICCEILLSLLACHAPPDDIMSKMLDYLEETLENNNIKEARHVMGVLHSILYQKFWCDLGLNEISRLLRFYHSSVEETKIESQYYQLRRGFEMCLRRFFEIIANNDLNNVITVMMNLCFDTGLSDEAMLDFGSTVEYAAVCYETLYITISIEPHIFEYMLEVIASDNPHRSILGCRILSRLLDRHNNYSQFNTPRIFFDDTIYDLKISQYYNFEKKFIKNYRNLIENSIMYAIVHHSGIRVNLEAIYTLIGLISCEVPCGYVTATLVTLAMQIQKFVLTNEDIPKTQENWLHGTIISIMTLLCWIDRSWSLSNYIKSIVKKRCDEAPFLNPPLKASYQYAQHHVIWNKIELFFDPWELRYGIWKRYRCEEVALSAHPSRFTEKRISNEKRSYHKSSSYFRSSMDSFKFF